jgi:arsenate reductase (glutaredoxin)
MTTLTVYTLSNCDTCRRATKWLRAQGIAFAERAIRETPPTPAELEQMLAACDGELRRVCNVSGREYRDQKIGARLSEISREEAVALLAANGNLVKRPFLIGPRVALVGFDEAAWRAALK